MTSKNHIQPFSQDSIEGLPTKTDNLQETVNPTTVDVTSDKLSEGSGKPDEKQLIKFKNDPVIGLIQNCKIVRTNNGKNYIRLEQNCGQQDNHYISIASEDFKNILTYLYLDKKEDEDKLESNIRIGLRKLQAIAAVHCKPEPVFFRFAYAGDAVYLGLNDKQQQAVQITANGWEVLSESPVPFIYPASALPIPTPIKGGSLNDLRKLLNVDEKKFMFIVAWLLMALRGKGPYPVLNLIGPAGSTKTTIATIIRNLIDPDINPLTTKSNKVHDLHVVAANNAILNLNNISNLSDAMSDALCAISTEGGTANRALYTDSGEASLDNYRPVIINGISTVVTRGDLIDRTLFVYLSRIPPGKRRTQASIMTEFEAKRAGILGVLLDGVASALKHFHTIELDSLPRMADFARWVSAAALGMNGELDSFINYYNKNQEDALADSLEYSPTAQAIIKLMPNPGTWPNTNPPSLGTMTELLTALKRQHEKNNGKLPNTAQQLSSELTRIEHLLATQNITLTRNRSASVRGITLTKTA